MGKRVYYFCGKGLNFELKMRFWEEGTQQNSQDPVCEMLNKNLVLFFYLVWFLCNLMWKCLRENEENNKLGVLVVAGSSK